MNDDRHIREKVETLDGSRSSSPDLRQQQAVRVVDLSGLLALKTDLQSTKAAGAAPTAAEFDALVEDVHRLQARLIQVQEALSKKLR